MIIFITGRSGSGKSTISKMICEKLGYEYINADQISYSMFNNPEILNFVRNYFGEKIFTNGNFDRKKFGQVIFSREKEDIQEYVDLSWNFMNRELSKIVDTKDNVLIDWVLLPQSQIWEKPSFKVLVKTNEKLREKRVLARNNISKEDFQNRNKAEINYDENQFDVILTNNSKSLTKLIEKFLNTFYDKNDEKNI